MSSGSRLLGWVMVLVWLAWGEAVEGWLATRPSIAAWVPDLGLIVFLAIGGRLGAKLMARRNETVGGVGLILAATFAEGAVSSLGTAAVVVGWLIAWGWLRLWRRGFDVELTLTRPWVAGTTALLLIGWRHVVLLSSTGVELDKLSASVRWFDAGAWHGALTTAVLAPLLMPVALRLPGVSLYWKDR